MHSHLDSENSGGERDGEVVLMLMHGEESSPLSIGPADDLRRSNVR
jgi:hypothetical protein